MANIDDKQLDKMVADIASIKSVIDKNQGLFQDMLLPQHFRVFSFFMGIAVIVFSMTIFFLQIRYGSWVAAPQAAKAIVYGALVVCWIVAAFLKWSRWGRGLMKINRAYTLTRAVEQFFSFRIVHVYMPLVGIGLILSFYLYHNNLAYYIICAISILMGLIYNFLGSFAGSRQWLVGGYWLMLSGLCLLLLDPIPAPIAVAMSPGCGLLAFAFVSDREN